MLLICSAIGHAQERANQYIEKRYNIFFRINSPVIERDFKGNARTIDQMKADIDSTLKLDGAVPDSLLILSTASPDGGYEFNKRLARNRAASTERLLLEMFPEFAGAHIKVEYLEEDWDGLRQVLRQNPDFPQGKEMLEVINSTRNIDNKEYALRALKAGWRHLTNNYIHVLRNSSITLKVVRTESNLDEYVFKVELFLITEGPFNFPADGGEDVIRYKKSIEGDDVVPVVTNDTDWVKDIAPYTDSATFAVAPNPSKNPRTTTINIEAYDQTHQVTVNQEGRIPELTFTTPSPMYFPAEGGSDIIKYESNVIDGETPLPSSLADHVSVVEYSDSCATIMVEPNQTPEERRSIVEVLFEGKVYPVEVIQAPGAYPEWRKTIIAPRSNLLVPGMNIGLEIPIKDNWSIGLDYYYPWFVSKENLWCGEMLGWFIDAKYWFPGKKYQWEDASRLKGHAIGVYGGIGYYDYQNKAHGIQGEYLDLGIDYTFALPVAEDKLRLEFNIGVGYIYTLYRPYYPSSDYEDLIKEPGIKYRSTNFIGPTRASVSLVYPITVKVKHPEVKAQEKAERKNRRKGGNE